MAKVEIGTTQNVYVDYEVATVGDRIVAVLIDYGVFIAYYFVAFGILIGSGVTFQSPFLYVVVGFPPLIYDLLCEILFNGQSLGKRVMNIKVIKLDGTQPTIGSYFIRHIMRLIDSPSFLTISLGVWWIGFMSVLSTGRGQRLGDIAAGTTVIKLSRKTRLHNTILHYQVDPNYNPVFAQVSNLSDRDIGTIKSVVRQCMRTKNFNALQLLTNKVKETMGLTPAQVGQMRDLDFLHIVVKDYSNYKFETAKVLRA